VVNPRRRLAPYVLLGLLTLGAGLGVGLGLSQGPVTYTATAPRIVYLRAPLCTVSGGGFYCKGTGGGSPCVGKIVRTLANASEMSAAAEARRLKSLVSRCARDAIGR